LVVAWATGFAGLEAAIPLKHLRLLSRGIPSAPLPADGERRVDDGPGFTEER